MRRKIFPGVELTSRSLGRDHVFDVILVTLNLTASQFRL